MIKMMMIKEKRDIRPLLVKFGVALAISFAGYLYSRIRTKRINPSESPRSPPSVSDSDRKVDYGRRLRIKEDSHAEMDSLSIDSYDAPYIRVRVDSSSRSASPSGRSSGNRDGWLLPEFEPLVREFDATATTNRVVASPKTDVDLSTSIKKDSPKAIRTIERDNYERDNYEQEIENLKKKIRILAEREKKLEVQLLEFYRLKEQEKVLMELQSRLKINNMEARVFSMKIESLQADNRRLETQVADYTRVVSELEAAKTKIKQLKRIIRHDAEQNREKIWELRQRVANLRDQEHEDSDVHSVQERVEELEHEAEVLRKSNEMLQQENTDLVQRLESTQILASSLFEDPEKEDLCKERHHLMEEKENLAKEVERLKADRCADAEELVYLRWINACLRYELRNYQPPPGKTVARDLSKSLSPNSEKKAKQLILEYANTEDGDKEPSIGDFDYDHWPSSSHPSYLTDDHDDSPTSSNPSHNKPHHKKIKIFAKLRRLIRGKHGSHDNHPQRGQTSPIIRSLSVDDIGRRYALEAGPDSETRSPMLTSSSQNSNRSSLENQRLSSLAEEESYNKASDSEWSPHGGVRFVLGRRSSSPLDYRAEQEGEDDGQKAELAKYAEVLRDSQRVLMKHKKSASFSIG